MSLDKELYRDKHPASFRETQARKNFNEAREYAISLIEIHDDITGAKAGRPAQELEALKRSALVFAVTAWETFVEDTAKEQLEILLGQSSSPASSSRISSIFNHAAKEWLGEPDTAKPKPPTLAQWTGNEWQKSLIKSLETYLKTFHTPNSENVKELFSKYLGIKGFPQKWKWQGVNSSSAEKKLNELIQLRGEVVHVGKKRRAPGPGPALKAMQRKTVINALNLIYNLMDTTEKALGVSPSRLPLAPSN